MTFGIDGGLEAGKRFYDALKLFKRLVNMGDAKSLACHPASTTHRQMSAEEQGKAGVKPEMIRLSIGIEHIDDIIADLDQALAAAAAAALAAARRRIGVAGAENRPDAAPCSTPRNPARPSEVHAANCVTVGLINNMPDAALEATERQFTDLIRASTRNTVVRLLLFSIPEVPRADAARRDMAGRYRDVAELWDTRLDGLIVTGTEPRSKNLKDEPYWARSVAGRRLGARAHRFDDLVVPGRACRGAAIRRHRTPRVCRKAFRRVRLRAGGRTSDDARRRRCRCAFPTRAATICPSGRSKRAAIACSPARAAAGVDMFARQERSFHLFLQGHPEYEPGTLLREYRRDIGRYLRGEREQLSASAAGLFRRRSDGDASTPSASAPLPIGAATFIASFPYARAGSRPCRRLAFHPPSPSTRIGSTT